MDVKDPIKTLISLVQILYSTRDPLFLILGSYVKKKKFRVRQVCNPDFVISKYQIGKFLRVNENKFEKK